MGGEATPSAVELAHERLHPRGDEVKKEFINVRSLRDWTAVLETWYAHEAPGVWPAPNAADEVNLDPAMQSCEVSV